MGAYTFPAVVRPSGEFFDPGVRRTRAVRVIGSSTQKASDSLTTETPIVTLDSTGAKTLFKVPKGILIKDIVWNKIKAFGATGGTITMGDTDVDGFFVSTGVITSDVGVKSFAAGAAAATAYKQGRWVGSTGDTYDTDNLMAITVTVTTAGFTSGVADVYLEYVDLNTMEP